MRTLYLDCASGISGDMALGALVGLGAPMRAVTGGLASLGIEGYRISSKPVTRAGMRATKVTVAVDNAGAPARTLRDITRIIKRSALPAHLKSRSLAIFTRIFEAEARAHGVAIDKAHLHELGAVDAVVDIVGSVVALDALGISRVTVSPVNLGSGSVKTEHGLLPVPVPAVAELLKGKPVYGDSSGHEMTTPTGAAILAEIADAFGPMPLMRMESTGAGAGARDLPERPNVLRAFLGAESAALETVTVIEANIDDMTPEALGLMIDRALAAGALDAYLTPAHMKKNRPGIVLTVLCRPADFNTLSGMVLRETTTLGIRHHEAARTVLGRAVRTVRTKFGAIRVKDALMDGEVIRSVPEYEDCRRAAEARGAAFIDVYNEAVRRS